MTENKCSSSVTRWLRSQSSPGPAPGSACVRLLNFREPALHDFKWLRVRCRSARVASGLGGKRRRLTPGGRTAPPQETARPAVWPNGYSHRKGAKQALRGAAAAHGEDGTPSPRKQELPEGSAPRGHTHSGSLLRKMSTLQRELVKAQIIGEGNKPVSGKTHVPAP